MINFDLVKPGHILKFGTCPSTILSPKGVSIHSGLHDNTRETPWPTTRHLGLVRCFSHPSGDIGKIAAEVAGGSRTTGGSLLIRMSHGVSRAASYTTAGRAMTQSNRAIGQANCDFVGYTDGFSNYIPSAATVFSKDFSGCLMVVYSVNGERRVAHAAASINARMDCKQAFLDTLQGQNAQLLGWFKPAVGAADADRKLAAYRVISKYVGKIDDLTTFGIIPSTAAGAGAGVYSLDAFKPRGMVDWVVTAVLRKTLTVSWTA